MTTAILNSAVGRRWYRSSVSAVLAGLFANAILSSAVATWGIWQSWYSLAIIAVTLPSGWLGALIAQARSGR